MTDRDALVEPMKLELTAHLVGAVPHYPREWGPALAPIDPQARDYHVDLVSRDSGRLWITAVLSGLTVIKNDWFSAVVALSSMDGHPFGTRPVLIYAEPYDVPVYSNFHVAELGHFSLGLRVIA